MRKTIGVLIAAKCLESGYWRLRSDRDSGPFAQRLGLRLAGKGT